MRTSCGAWAKLGNEIRVIKIYETLDEVSLK